MITNANHTARYHFAVKQTEEGGVLIAFEPLEGDVFDTSGIWLAMRNPRAAEELAAILNRSVVLVGRTASTDDTVGGWSN